MRGEVDYLMTEFKLSEALKLLYSLIWNDFCSWYLEWIKPGFEEQMPTFIYQKTVAFYDTILQMLHPFMPFITEEIYHLIENREDDLCVKQFKGLTEADDANLQQGYLLQQLITGVRDAKQKNGIKPREAVNIFIQTNSPDVYEQFDSIFRKQVSAQSISFVKEAVENTIILSVDKDRLFIQSDAGVDKAGLRMEIEKNLEHQQNFLAGVRKKLANERFVQNAKPEVIALEQRKQSDAEARIRLLEESLHSL